MSYPMFEVLMNVEEYHDRQNEKLAKQIMELPDDIVISYDFQGKHYAYTAEYMKRVMGEWLDTQGARKIPLRDVSKSIKVSIF
jgi:hypothetical protein